MLRRLKMLGLGILVLIFLVLMFNSASAVDLNCGDTITTDTVLTSDILDCNGVDGVIIGADNITLNCDNHKIQGVLPVSSKGININSFDDITIKNCEISNFNIGINLNNTQDCNVSNNNIVSYDSGFYINRDVINNIFQNNIITTDLMPIQIARNYGHPSHSNYFFDNNLSGAFCRFRGDKTSMADSNAILINSPCYISDNVEAPAVVYVGWWIDVNIVNAVTLNPLSATLTITDSHNTEYFDDIVDDNFQTIYLFDYNIIDSGITQYYSPYDFNLFKEKYIPIGLTTNIDENKEFIFYMSLDFNIEILKINNYPDSNITQIFSYIQDENIVIDFNIHSPTLQTFNVDMNYSPQNIDGTGNIILNDVNSNILCENEIFNENIACIYNWDISGVNDGNYYINIKLNLDGFSEFDATDDNFMIDNSAPEVSDIIINYGNNLDGIDYDLNATITDLAGINTVTYKCYSNENEAECVSESWDCHLGNMQDLGNNIYGATVTGTGKDTIGTWYCKIFSEDIVGNDTEDTNSAVMNIVLSISVDATSGVYTAEPNSTENAVYTDQNKEYVVITNTGNDELDVTIQATKLEGYEDIAVTNQKWNITDSYDSSIAFTGEIDMIIMDLDRGTYPNAELKNVYFWLDAPDLLYAGEYTGVLTFGVSS